MKFNSYILIFQSLLESNSIKKNNFANFLGIFFEGIEILLNSLLINFTSLDLNNENINLYLQMYVT